MKKFLRGLGSATFGALALAATAAAQTYPPYSGQNYSAPPYPSQPYPSQPYPSQSYPSQSYPAQSYPAENVQTPPPQTVPAQNQSARRPGATSQACARLQGQLATLNSGAANPAHAAQIQREQQAIDAQQAQLDQTLAQAQRVGCEGQGFFSLFSGLSPRCGPLVSKIQQMRGNLDTMMSELEQLKSGSTDQDAQRNALIAQLAQNNCGAQYTTAARAAGPQGFFEALLGGGTVVNPNGNEAPAGTYRTVCVRTCDGFYFPISYSTKPAKFSADAQTCQRLCPNASCELFTYHNPGEQIEQAVSLNGAPYTALPNAFRYRKQLVPGCYFRKPGESWAEALRNADTSSTLERGDIVVTGNGDAAPQATPGAEQKGTPGKLNPQQAAPSASGAPNANAGSHVSDAAEAEQVTGVRNAPAADLHRKVRIVGPPFIATNQSVQHKTK